MKKSMIAFAFLASSLAHAEVPGPTTYADLIAKADAGEKVDFTALRRAYTASPGYAPYSEESRTLFIDAFTALEAHDCATATAKAKQSLAIDYVNFALHGFLSECLEHAGDHAGAAREDAIRVGLIDSLTGNGDGKSVATAYVVVTMAEERALLAINDVEEDEQALLMSNGHEFDRITGKGKDGQTHTMFFDVTAPFESLGRALEKPKGEPK